MDIHDNEQERRVRVLAHRGAPGPWRENTLRAFEAARSLGADGVELDVRLLADGTLAVHHDPVLQGVGALHRLSHDDLPSWLPSLSDALEACAGMDVDIEVKNLPGDPAFDPSEALATAVADEILRFATGGTPGEGTASGPEGRIERLLVTSFWAPSLLAVRKAAPQVSTGLLLHPAFDPLESIPVAEAAGCRVLLPHWGLLEGDAGARLVERAHERQMAVAAWSPSDATGVQAMIDAGVDAVVTDVPAVALEVVRLVERTLRREQSGP